jgi:hypothetical protein
VLLGLSVLDFVEVHHFESVPFLFCTLIITRKRGFVNPSFQLFFTALTPR